METIYTDEAIQAKIDGDKDSGAPFVHANSLRELLKVPVEYRARVLAEAYTLNNVVGGILSGNVYAARAELQRNIDAGEPERELYGENFARVAREREAELRRITGDPAAIYNPFR